MHEIVLRYPAALLPSSEQAGDQRHDEQNKENEKENLGDFSGAGSNTTESKHGGNQRDDEKYQRIVEHL
jgi:hypothetical protein